MGKDFLAALEPFGSYNLHCHAGMAWGVMPAYRLGAGIAPTCRPEYPPRQLHRVLAEPLALHRSAMVDVCCPVQRVSSVGRIQLVVGSPDPKRANAEP